MLARKTFWTGIVRRFLNLSRTMFSLSLARLLQLVGAGSPAVVAVGTVLECSEKIPLDDTHLALAAKKCYTSIFSSFVGNCF